MATKFKSKSFSSSTQALVAPMHRCSRMLGAWPHSLLPNLQTYHGVKSPATPGSFMAQASPERGLFPQPPNLERHPSAPLYPLSTATLICLHPVEAVRQHWPLSGSQRSICSRRHSPPCGDAKALSIEPRASGSVPRLSCKGQH